MKQELMIVSPCPRHGTDFAMRIEHATICMAPTPDEISDKCWYHMNLNTVNRIKYCPDCKREEILTEIKPHDNYCKPHKCLRTAAATKKHKVAI